MISAEEFIPNPVNLLESNRSLGYSIEEAVSDLIDNSISANSKNISFHILRKNSSPKFILLDDGNGMSLDNDELVNSFKLASMNPLEKRESNDLGRFGFGLKTASLSQSRSFIVITKRKNKDLISRALDLDFIKKKNKWILRCVENDEMLGFDKKIIEKGHGTAIIWNKWDKSPDDDQNFTSLHNNIVDYLSVCFHKFIEDGIKIYSNETLINPCSPIPNDGGAKIQSTVSLKNSNSNLSAYVLQHPSKWDKDYDKSSLLNSFKLFSGFDRQQGIYIYRGNRLLTPKGGWLGLIRPTSHSKLARVTIEYPNDADNLWSLDIKKTSATIPFKFKKEIEKFIKKTKSASSEKIIRGNRTVQSSISNMNHKFWNEIKNDEENSTKYSININHPYINKFIKEESISKKELKSLFDIISDSLPVYNIIQNNDEDPSTHDRASKIDKLDKRHLNYAKLIIDDIILDGGTKAMALSYLLSNEPYCFYEKQVKLLLNE